jgi:hypothetical protein
MGAGDNGYRQLRAARHCAELIHAAVRLWPGVRRAGRSRQSPALTPRAAERSAAALIRSTKGYSATREARIT